MEPIILRGCKWLFRILYMYKKYLKVFHVVSEKHFIECGEINHEKELCFLNKKSSLKSNLKKRFRMMFFLIFTVKFFFYSKIFVLTFTSNPVDWESLTDLDIL